MTPTILVDSDIGHDATDCRLAWNAGNLKLATGPKKAAVKPKFGDDDGDFAEDGQCDDPRFIGLAMSDELYAEDILHDASDCREAWNNGDLRLVGIQADGAPRFGDDDGEYSFDGECDDPRFDGDGMTVTDLYAEDILHDATDCRTAWQDGDISLR